MTEQIDAVRDQVHQRYAAAATAVSTGTLASCCGIDTSGTVYDIEVAEGFGCQLDDPAERDQLPPEAVTASLGCGNPLAVTDLHDGDKVLDRGPGGGIDVLLPARRVGPTGKAYGLDMTEECSPSPTPPEPTPSTRPLSTLPQTHTAADSPPRIRYRN
jgi:arsenite methyltransferase